MSEKETSGYDQILAILALIAAALLSVGTLGVGVFSQLRPTQVRFRPCLPNENRNLMPFSGHYARIIGPARHAARTLPRCGKFIEGGTPLWPFAP